MTSRDSSPRASPATRARNAAIRLAQDTNPIPGPSEVDAVAPASTLSKEEIKLGVVYSPETHVDGDLTAAFLDGCKVASSAVRSHRVFHSTVQVPDMLACKPNLNKEAFVESPAKLRRMLLIDDLEALESSRVQQQLVYDLEDSGVCGNDSSLQFDSRFECGNLRQAYQMFGTTYDLILNVDTHSTGYFQWFYFHIDNVVPGTCYKFNILNNEKPGSQFNSGMQPLVFDPKTQVWKRDGFKIVYQRNAYLRGKTKLTTSYYWSLTFSIAFPHEGPFFLAYHYPFSYSDCQRWLNGLVSRCAAEQLPILHRQLLCTTMAGNRCELLTLTDTSATALTAKPIDERPVVVLSARVHPGESNSSWTMKGTLDFLCSSHPKAVEARQTFVFKIVPMLNPDGVIHGNTRCSLSGKDLNRQWIQPDCVHHAPVYHLKLLLRSLIAEGRQPALFVDMHGHSRRKNVFCYGCQHGGPGEEQLLVDVLSHEAHLFSSRNSKFGLEKSKEATGRVVAWKLGIQCSYTMEASYCGADQGKYQGYQLNQHHLCEMGEQFARSLLVWRACQQAVTASSSRASTEVELDLRGMSPVHLLLRRHGSGTSFPDSDPVEPRDEDLDEEDEEEDGFDIGNASSSDLYEEDEESDANSLHLDGNDDDDDGSDVDPDPVLPAAARVSLSASATPASTGSPITPLDRARVAAKVHWTEL